MNVIENVLKELYSETYEKVIASPIHTQLKLDLTKNIESEALNSFKNLKFDVLIKPIDNGLEYFREQYGEGIQAGVTNIAGREYERQNALRKETNDKIKRDEWLEKTYYYIYLQNRLILIENELKKFFLKPVTDKDGSIIFVEIKKP